MISYGGTLRQRRSASLISCADDITIQKSSRNDGERTFGSIFLAFCVQLPWSKLDPFVVQCRTVRVLYNEWRFCQTNEDRKLGLMEGGSCGAEELLRVYPEVEGVWPRASEGKGRVRIYLSHSGKRKQP